MTGNTVREYREFIEDAYIKPIRSVLVVDDDYPTIEDMLKTELGVPPESSASKKWRQNPGQVLKVVENFRTKDPSLIVDIHDGESLSTQDGDVIASHLHQSDLLILDYELNDDGQKAVDIAGKVFANRHFNLIVIHTSSEPKEPFKQILLSLLGPHKMDAGDIEKVQAGLNAIQKAEDDAPDVSTKVKAAIGFSQYLSFRNDPRTAFQRIRSGEGAFAGFHTISQELGWDRAEPNNILLWAISEYESSVSDVLGDGSQGPQRWSDSTSDGRLWIRSNQGFITFVQKSDDIDLLKELHDSLMAWGPSPSRMLSAKIRAKIEDEGVIAEDKILSGRHIHAKFYQNLACGNKTEDERTSLIEVQIDRQIEFIVSQIKAEVTAFMNEIVSSDNAAQQDVGEIVVKHYDIDLSVKSTDERAVKMFNSYVSCKSDVSGWHIEPGHIFDIGDEKWVCLSPICDLVPTQKSIGIFGEVGDAKPFIAVKLHRRDGVLDSKKINSNSFVFLPDPADSGDIVQYGFYAGDDANPEETVSPHWNLFLAQDKGRFGSNKKINLTKIKEGEGGLELEHVESSIGAQLRYEYALNLMQKFGSEFTRVGLGFIAA